MGDLVDQILLFASAEDRNKRVSLQTLAVEQIVETVLSDTEVLVRDAGFTLDLEGDPALPHALGDLSGITQCLRNLVGNAVKYGGCAQGSKPLGVASPPREQALRDLPLIVTHTGPVLKASEIA